MPRCRSLSLSFVLKFSLSHTGLDGVALSGRPTLTLVALDANTPVPARPVPAVAEAFLALLQPVVIAVPHPMPHRSTRGRFAVAHVQVSCARARGRRRQTLSGPPD